MGALTGCLPCCAKDAVCGAMRRLSHHAVLPASQQESIVGSWYYGTSLSEQTHYRIVEDNSVLTFQQDFTNGNHVSGELLPEGEWLVSTLKYIDGTEQGTIRVRWKDESIISNFKSLGSQSWEYDIAARRSDADPKGDKENYMRSTASMDSVAGCWRYPASLTAESCYSIKIQDNGDLIFDQRLSDGNTVSGKLLPEGEWLVCLLTYLDKRDHGIMRLRKQSDTIISNLKSAGSDSWEHDITARKVDAEPDGDEQRCSRSSSPSKREVSKAEDAFENALVSLQKRCLSPADLSTLQEFSSEAVVLEAAEAVQKAAAVVHESGSLLLAEKEQACLQTSHELLDHRSSQDACASLPHAVLQNSPARQEAIELTPNEFVTELENLAINLKERMELLGVAVSPAVTGPLPPGSSPTRSLWPEEGSASEALCKEMQTLARNFDETLALARSLAEEDRNAARERSSRPLSPSLCESYGSSGTWYPSPGNGISPLDARHFSPQRQVGPILGIKPLPLPLAGGSPMSTPRQPLRTASAVASPASPLLARGNLEAKRSGGAQGNGIHQSAANFRAKPSTPRCDAIKMAPLLDVLEGFAKDLEAIKK